MIRLLKIELNKIIYNKTFWIIFGLHFLLLIPTAFGLEGILKLLTYGSGGQAQKLPDSFSVFNYPNVWLNLAYLASWFEYILAILLIILVTNEYNYKTLRQNIIDGMSKWEVIWAKELVILMISLIAVVTLVLFTFLIGNKNASISMFTGSVYLFGYLLQLILFLNFAYFMSVLIKRTGLVIGLLFIYRIAEWIFSLFLPDNIGQLLPMSLIGNMVPNPIVLAAGEPSTMTAQFTFQNMSMGVVYLGIFIGLNYFLLKRGHAAK